MIPSIVEGVKYRCYDGSVRTRVKPTRDVSELFHALVDRMRQSFMSVAAEFDLTPPQLGVLKSLEDSVSMSEVASMMQCDASNVTWITDRLESRGLVERRPDPQDRRVKRLVLTEEGRRVKRLIDRRLVQVPGVRRLTAEERDTLARLLARVLDDA
jgi:MarR family transcriptional regulator, organic hydroperoxide resistance regulator